MNGGMNYWIVKHTAAYRRGPARAEARPKAGFGASFSLARAASSAAKSSPPPFRLFFRSLSLSLPHNIISSLRPKFIFFSKIRHSNRKFNPISTNSRIQRSQKILHSILYSIRNRQLDEFSHRLDRYFPIDSNHFVNTRLFKRSFRPSINFPPPLPFSFSFSFSSPLRHESAFRKADDGRRESVPAA